jgi:hypothetical protein
MHLANTGEKFASTGFLNEKGMAGWIYRVIMLHTL